MDEKSVKKGVKKRTTLKYIPVNENSRYVKAVLILPKEIIYEIARLINNRQSPVLWKNKENI